MKTTNIESEWLKSYNAVWEYIKTHNCIVSDIPKTVTDKNGIILRVWFYKQIRIYLGYGEQSLSEEQKNLLMDIGINDFITLKDRKWHAHLEELVKYYNEHHNFIITDDYLCEDGANLKLWLKNQKASFVKGSLREDRVQAIVDCGLSEILNSRTEVTIHHLELFYQQNGHINVPSDYICEDGFRLGRTVRMLRTLQNKGELPQEFVDRLDLLGMIWDKKDYSWNENFEICKEYHTMYGNLDFTEDMAEQEVRRLKLWIQSNRYKYLHGELSKERTGLLYSIGALDVNLFPKRKMRTESPEDDVKLRRDKTLRVRMTEDEFDSLIAKAKADGYESISEYVRNILL